MVIILDCCYSGGFIEEIGEKGRVVLAACQKNSSTYQEHSLKSGIFGYFVNLSLQKITKGAEVTFLVAYVSSIIYSKKLSQKFGADYTIYPSFYDGIFGRTKIIKYHPYFNTFLRNLFPLPNRDDNLRIWKV